MKEDVNLKGTVATGLLVAFLLNSLGLIPAVQAQEFVLPKPGAMVPLSLKFDPPILKGIKVHPDNPFRFDFILDPGDSSKTFKTETAKLIKYFLASLTIPDKDLWVNLSPYEKNRIIPQAFGQTEMGRDLLAEDYMLKQITASLIYPEGETGKRFWKRVYQETAKKFGSTNIPVNTFNKVWIVPDKAVVYENAKAGTAYVVEARLKVMLEQDYLSLQKHASVHNDAGTIGDNIIREVVIPELTREVNENKNFSQLRQVYNSLILAAWYKKKVKESILSQVYEDKNKVSGILSYPNVAVGDPEQIYQRYLQAFKQGVFNYIKEEPGPLDGILPRRYFSGGVDERILHRVISKVTTIDSAQLGRQSDLVVAVNIDKAAITENMDRPQAVQVSKGIDTAMKAWNMYSVMYRISHIFKNQNIWIKKRFGEFKGSLWISEFLLKRDSVVEVQGGFSLDGPRVPHIKFNYRFEINIPQKRLEGPVFLYGDGSDFVKKNQVDLISVFLLLIHQTGIPIEYIQVPELSEDNPDRSRQVLEQVIKKWKKRWKYRDTDVVSIQKESGPILRRVNLSILDYKKIENYFSGQYAPSRWHSAVGAMKRMGKFLMNPAMKGGIDLSSAEALTVHDKGQNIIIHLDPAELAQWQESPGVAFEIINFQPLKNIYQFLNTPYN